MIDSFPLNVIQYYCTASVSLRPSSIGHHHSITANPSHNFCSNPTKFLILCFCPSSLGYLGGERKGAHADACRPMPCRSFYFWQE